MADISAFAEEGFEPAAWVNEICKQKPADETVDRFLAEMEMRLQLAAEEIDAGLQESSAAAMRRIPFVVQEIYRLQGDVQGMQDQVKVLAAQVSQSAQVASISVSRIEALDGIKHNMEAACSTLKEATELSGMFTKVESVFASGDLPRVADLLRSMRASLALVGDVPEFREGRGKLRALEDRLQAQVEGALATALAAPHDAAVGADGSPQDADAHTRSLCSLLLAVDRYHTVESLYVAARVGRAQAVWDEAASSHARQQPASQWLPALHARLLPFLRAELAWLDRVLPAHRTQLAAKLFGAVFDKVGAATTQRLRQPGTTVPVLIAAAASITSFAGAVADALPPDTPPDVRSDLLSQALAPLEDAVGRYPSLEAAALDAEIHGALRPITDGAATGALDPNIAVRKLWDAVRLAAASCCSAVERCVALTSGSDLAALATVLDEVLAGLLARVVSYTTQLAAKAGSAASVSLGLDEGPDDAAASALQLVVLANEAAGGTLLRRVETALRAAVGAALPRLEAAATAASQAGGAALKPAPPRTPTASTAGATASKAQLQPSGVDPVALRVSRNPERLRSIQRWAEQLSDPRYNPLPQASAQAEALVKGTQAAALETLLARVRGALAPVPGLPVWGKRSGGGGEGYELPSFSTDASPYVTLVGEYLMMLPQQLDALFGQELMAGSMTQDEQEELAAQWLDMVVMAAGAAYTDTITRIPSLSLPGGAQLAGDVEYFCNVMTSLQVAPPPSLLTVQMFAGMPDAEFVSTAKAMLADGSVDAPTLRLLGSLRHLSLAS